MRPSDIADRSFGYLVPAVGGEMAFVPNNLPPKIDRTAELVRILSDADRAIGRLHGIGLNLPNPNLLITPFIRREAELSSRIEGTQANIEQLYLFEVQEPAANAKTSDVKEVVNYVLALEHALARSSELPVCLRLIRELHAILLKGVRGEQSTPGEFRKVQNWIGPKGTPIEQASYVPPPPDRMVESLDAFEKFLNSPAGSLPVLLWLAMVHYQFEAIHPFLDGNGRIGRVLITLLLCSKGVLDKPLLYLSVYFERNRQEYYERLLRVSTNGQWTEWLMFFLRGIVEQSEDAFQKARQLLDLQQQYHGIVKSRRSAAQMRLVDLLIERPVITTVFAGKYLNVTYAAAQRNIAMLIKEGILKELTGRKRNRVYIAEQVLQIISKPFSKT